jgi:hypothetical protein
MSRYKPDSSHGRSEKHNHECILSSHAFISIIHLMVIGFLWFSRHIFHNLKDAEPRADPCPFSAKAEIYRLVPEIFCFGDHEIACVLCRLCYSDIEIQSLETSGARINRFIALLNSYFWMVILSWRKPLC